MSTFTCTLVPFVSYTQSACLACHSFILFKAFIQTPSLSKQYIATTNNITPEQQQQQ